MNAGMMTSGRASVVSGFPDTTQCLLRSFHVAVTSAKAEAASDESKKSPGFFPGNPDLSDTAFDV
jgi:hypothetical protein